MKKKKKSKQNKNNKNRPKKVCKWQCPQMTNSTVSNSIPLVFACSIDVVY